VRPAVEVVVVAVVVVVAGPVREAVVAALLVAEVVAALPLVEVAAAGEVRRHRDVALAEAGLLVEAVGRRDEHFQVVEVVLVAEEGDFKPVATTV
jgi:hypothetical protein